MIDEELVKELGGPLFPGDRKQSHSRQPSNENETSYNDSYHNYNDHYLEATLNDRSQFMHIESSAKDRNTSGLTREN